MYIVYDDNIQLYTYIRTTIVVYTAESLVRYISYITIK